MAYNEDEHFKNLIEDQHKNPKATIEEWENIRDGLNNTSILPEDKQKLIASIDEGIIKTNFINDFFPHLEIVSTATPVQLSWLKPKIDNLIDETKKGNMNKIISAITPVTPVKPSKSIFGMFSRGKGGKRKTRRSRRSKKRPLSKV